MGGIQVDEKLTIMTQGMIEAQGIQLWHGTLDTKIRWWMWELSLIVWHNEYVLGMIEQFLKLLKLVPLPYHNIKWSTYAF